MSSLRRKLRTASGMTRADRRLIVEAIAALLVARRRSLLPFEGLARHLGGIVAPHSRTRAPAPASASASASASAPAPAPVLPAPLSQAEADMIFAIRWSIGAVAPWLPFRTLCLQQAIAARAMLERRGIGSVLHLGVRDPTGTTLDAHAWLDAGGLNVTGYPVDPALTEVGRFV